MSDDSTRQLRGREPLTVIRGANGVGQHVYFSQIVDPRAIDPSDRDRLVGEGFLEWVVADGESWKLAEDSGSGSAGDPVTVSSAAMADPDNDPVRLRDPGIVNKGAEPFGSVMPGGAETPTPSSTEEPSKTDGETGDDAAAEARREAAAAKLPADGSAPDGRASKDVWVEYAVAKGYDRATVESADRDEIKALFKG